MPDGGGEGIARGEHDFLAVYFTKVFNSYAAGRILSPGIRYLDRKARAIRLQQHLFPARENRKTILRYDLPRVSDLTTEQRHPPLRFYVSLVFDRPAQQEIHLPPQERAVGHVPGNRHEHICPYYTVRTEGHPGRVDKIYLPIGIDRAVEK